MYSVSLVKDSHVSIKAEGGRQVYSLCSAQESLMLTPEELAIVEKSINALVEIGIITLTDLSIEKEEEDLVVDEMDETMTMDIVNGLLSSEGLNYAAFTRVLDASNPDHTFSKKHIREVYDGILEILGDTIYRQGHDWFKQQNHDE